MSAASRFYLALIGGFLFLPILVLVVFSFNASALMSFPLSGFTLDWYVKLSGNEALIHGFVTSFLIAQPVGLASAALGLLAALALTARDFRLRAAFVALLIVPFLVPKSVLAIAGVMITSRIGFERGAVMLIAGQTLVFLPFTAVILTAVMVRLDGRLEEAARDLGASPFETFRKAVFPQLKSALTAAYAVGVILSSSDLTLSMFLAGRTQPLSLIVASAFRRELSPELNAMQVVVLAITALAVVATELLRRGTTVARVK